jgi:thiol-disulfide isomerase/thioredoxin
MISIRCFIISMCVFFLAACSNPASLEWQALELTDLEGNPVNMEQYAGKRIFLNFWATWCGPCLAEMPSMEKARRELADQAYVFVLVSDEQPETIKAFQDRRGYGFDYLRLDQSIKTAGIFSIPQSYLIDSNGNVVEAITGATNWESEAAMQLLRSID